MRTFQKSHAIVFAAVSAFLSHGVFAAQTANSSTTSTLANTTGTLPNPPAETITFEGQGSLNKVIGTPAFGYLNLTGTNATTSITLNNGINGAPVTYTNTSTSSGAYLNLANTNFTTGDTTTGYQQTHSALRLEWHWNGTVDGSNDLINDQVGYSQLTGSVAPQQGANRGPTVANPIYVNSLSHFDGLPTTGMAIAGSNNQVSLNGFNISNNGGIGTYNTYSSANYDQAGNNLLGGTNRVQFSFSDYKTLDYSLPGTPSPFAAPGTAGYGNGNPAIPAATNNLLGIGVNGTREAYQAGTIANMPTTNIDPSTVSTANPNGTAYAAGPWNTAGLDNISSTPVAANAVLIAANPGTGLSRLNKGDSQWIQTTGRLANGMMFNTVSRDADLGQRPSFATATGIDGTWAVGVNDGGDTTTTAAAVRQRTLGTMKFSGKSSDTEVYNAIAQSRMAAGVLALTSTISSTTTTAAGPVRSLDIDFADMTDPKTSAGATDASKFVTANLSNISTYKYAAVLLGYVTTIKTPNAAALAAYQAANPGLTDQQAWAQMNSFNISTTTAPVTGIKGDTTGDVAKFINNLLNPQESYQTLTSANDPADAFLINSYLLPNLLQNQRDPTTGVISPNPNYDAAAFAKATAIYSKKFDAAQAPFGKATETTGTAAGSATNSSNYGSAISGGQSPSTFNGNIPITSFNDDGSIAYDNVLAPGGNWLFGNFNQNGVRDFSAVQSALSAAKALYTAEPTGTTNANSAFSVTTGTPNLSNSSPITYIDSTGVSHTLTKGDLIVLGDYLSVARFDGASLAALARGAAISDASGTAGYTAGTLGGGITGFADAVRNGVSRKNDALAYMQANTADGSAASVFLRQTGRAVLTAAGVPRNATPLNTVDANSGLAQFTYDPAGTNSFNNHDVNRDGVVDFNDAVLVDNFNGQDYTNLAQQLAATQQAPVTGTIQSISLVNIKQFDGSTVIGSTDLAAVSGGLTGTGTTNWYGYTLNKTGPGTITFARTGGVVTVYPNAALQISAGKVTVASTIDPFTDSSATGLDTTKSVALTVTRTLEYAAGAKLDRLASLAIPASGQVTLDPSPAAAGRTVLVVGPLSVAGKIDLGNGDLIAQSGNLSYIAALLTNGNLLSTTAAADSTHTTAIGIIQNNQPGSAIYSASHLFDNVTPAASDVLVKYTYYGDANLDGKVDGSDYTLIDNGFNQKLTGWYNGDFNYDGKVDGSDYTLIDNAFNTQGAALTANTSAILADSTAQIAGTTAVPEPATVGVAALLVSLIGGRTRRIIIYRTGDADLAG